jgi:hypothetical protein
MKAFSKGGLLAVVALLAAAAMASSAQAVVINPPGVLVHGIASNPTLTYGVATVTCNTGTADSRGPTSNPASDRITDVALTFSGNCAVAGVGAATVSCQGFVTVIAETSTSATDNKGTVRLNAVNEPLMGDPVFRCVVTTALCTITVQGAQNTASQNVNLDETTGVLAANVNVQATRTGAVACGPAGPATANFTANYATSTEDPDTGAPADPLTID